MVSESLREAYASMRLSSLHEIDSQSMQSGIVSPLKYLRATNCYKLSVTGCLRHLLAAK